jgi:hypothetical protein
LEKHGATYTEAKSRKEQAKVNSRRHYVKHREAVIVRTRAYCKANLEQTRRFSRSSKARLRLTCARKLGGQCLRCETVDNLEFDHWFDNGSAHRKRYGGNNRTSTIVYWIRDTPLSEVLHGKYAIRLLCNECHRTKDKWAYPLALNDPLTRGTHK